MMVWSMEVTRSARTSTPRMRQRSGWLAWVSPRDWVVGRPCMMTPWVWWCGGLGDELRATGAAGDRVDDDAGLVDLDVVARVLDRHHLRRWSTAAHRCWPWFHASVRRATSDAEVGELPVDGGDDGHRQRAERADPADFVEGGEHVEVLAVDGRAASGAVARTIAAKSEPLGNRAELCGPGGRAGVDEDDAGHLVWEQGGERDRLGAAEGVADDHVRSGLTDRASRRGGRSLAWRTSRRAGRVAGARAGPVVRADTGSGGDGGFDVGPARGVAAEAGDQHHGRVALPTQRTCTRTPSAPTSSSIVAVGRATVVTAVVGTSAVIVGVGGASVVMVGVGAAGDVVDVLGVEGVGTVAGGLESVWVVESLPHAAALTSAAATRARPTRPGIVGRSAFVGSSS